MYKNRFCFRITKEGKVGWDYELDEHCEAYIELKMDTKEEIPTDAKAEMHKSILEDIAEQIGINSEFLIPISIEEFDTNVDED